MVKLCWFVIYSYPPCITNQIRVGYLYLKDLARAIDIDQEKRLPITKFRTVSRVLNRKMTADFRSTETTNFLSKYSLAIKILCVG